MAIYHLEAKVVSRGGGRSAVAAAAYMSCSQIKNDYDGVEHDYTRKQGLVWQEIFLPEHAPPEWSDRSKLWNAVEENEKTKDSRLAREFVVALPIEMGKTQWQKLLTEFIKENFVADGMCADVCIHDTDGHNPHAHIMVTVRPLAENGQWQYKTEKEYLCVRNGEEMGFTGAEFRQAQKEGWEKQYPYMLGRKKEYMTPSEAQARGLERASKTPKSTRFGRQNPIAARWNSDEQLVLWRSAWADVTNRHLERVGAEARIDHRSHAERGIPEQPTIHEGVTARAMEQQGFIADRCELNRQIKADNKLLRELRSIYEKIAKAVRNTVPAIAEALESLRRNMLIFRYQILHTKANRRSIKNTLADVLPVLRQYSDLVGQIKTLSRERKVLLEEKKATPVLNILKHRELAKGIAQLSEDIEELRSEKAMILSRFEKTEDQGMKEVKNWVTSMESSLRRLEQTEAKYQAELDAALAQFRELTTEAESMDKAELYTQRQLLRKLYTQDARSRLKEAHGNRYNIFTMMEAERDVDDLLLEEEKKPIPPMQEQPSESPPELWKKPGNREYER
ncbi:MAG TPA: MobA/MobL family protein [Candidatus Faecousia excrementipullorum]|nr:MobA/MobL family protein [Candidatus Faecousia excrementipullorum]